MNYWQNLQKEEDQNLNKGDLSFFKETAYIMDRIKNVKKGDVKIPKIPIF